MNTRALALETILNNQDVILRTLADEECTFVTKGMVKRLIAKLSQSIRLWGTEGLKAELKEAVIESNSQKSITDNPIAFAGVDTLNYSLIYNRFMFRLKHSISKIDFSRCHRMKHYYTEFDCYLYDNQLSNFGIYDQYNNETVQTALFDAICTTFNRYSDRIIP